MSIHSIDRDKLKLWLEVILEPLTEADPSALAKYVVALIKGKEQLQELRESLAKNLHVFLQDKTNCFVEYVLKLLDSQVYELPQWGTLVSRRDSVGFPWEGELHLPLNIAPNIYQDSRSRGGMSPMHATLDNVGQSTTMVPTSSKVDGMQIECEKTRCTLPRSSYGTDTHHTTFRERDKSGSQTWKSKSRTKHHHKNGKQNCYSHQNNLNGFSSDRLKLECCTSHSKNVPAGKSTLFNRNFFTSMNSKSDVYSNEHMLNREVSCDQDIHNVKRVQSIVSPCNTFPLESSIEMHTKPKCKDFEEKGYCMLGNMCLYDHGNNPVVVGDSSFVAYSNCCNNRGTFNDETSSLFRTSGCKQADFSRSYSSKNIRGLTKQLVPQNTSQKTMYCCRVCENCKNNCVLQIKNIPYGLNSINHISNHFSKFGNIVDIKVCFQEDPRCAVITFSSWFEANTAFKSSEPIFNNRFVKIFWYNANCTRETVSQIEHIDSSSQTSSNCLQPFPSSCTASNTHRRKDSISKLQSINYTTSSFKKCGSAEKVNIVKNSSFKIVYIPTPLKKLQITRRHSKWVCSKGTLRKNQDEKLKQALKLMTHMQKSKQHLIIKKIGIQKKSIGKLENTTQSSNEKAEIMSEIKSCEESILKLRSEVLLLMARSRSLLKSHSEVGRIKDDFQRELLDAELEYLAAENRGENTAEIKHKMEVLKKLVQLLGLCRCEPL
ncbi:RNA-binding protein 26-like isoform X2 [Bacillus rossius redtenbacheri]